MISLEIVKHIITYNIYNNIVDIISNDKLFLKKNNLEKERNYYVKVFISQRMNKIFKNLYNDCSIDTKKAIIEIFNNNLNFPKYFDDSNSNIYKEYFKELLKNKNNEDIDEIMEFIFKTKEEENDYWIILFFFQKKLEEKGFFEELEKNYGVYLNLEKDNFINEMNDKLIKIKNFYEMFKLIGCEFGTNINDYIQAIIKACKREEEKISEDLSYEISNERRYTGRGS